jgi:hypothetical protein
MAFVPIPDAKDIFLDAFPYTIYSLFPPKISHSYVEVNINGKYIRTDSFCVEKALFLKLMSKLIDENRFCGYGININSKCDWDAKSDSFSQFHRNLLEEDHGTFENPLDYYYEYHYTNPSSVNPHSEATLAINTTWSLNSEKRITCNYY